ncbi:hypothetical protein ACFQT0_21815 [Hymenobacter humi]|uniref:Uncharacterized protein n=1 Tax=Hymenobacter humi TaxID=1411620 RepID=A0ABW2U865_9BACT
MQMDSVLAEVLVHGALSLVQVAYPERPVHYLLLAPGRPPLDLSERKYLRQTVDHAWLLTDGNNYRGQAGGVLWAVPGRLQRVAEGAVHRQRPIRCSAGLQ